MEMSSHTMIRIMLENEEAVNIYNGLNELDLSEFAIEERDAINRFRDMLEFYL